MNNKQGITHTNSTTTSCVGGGGSSLIQAKLHLIDLAGSERLKRTGAGGLRLKETVGINQV